MIKEYLTAILFKTFVMSIPVTMLGIWMIMDPIDPTGSDLQGLVYGIAVYVILVLTLSSTTMYLNLLPQIRNSRYYSLLSFFALPCISAILVIYSLGEVMGQLAGYSMMVMPFFFILAFYYRKFWQQRGQYNSN